MRSFSDEEFAELIKKPERTTNKDLWVAGRLEAKIAKLNAAAVARVAASKRKELKRVKDAHK